LRVLRHLTVWVPAVAATATAVLATSAQPGSASTGPGPARFLPVTAAQQQQLRALYAGYRNIPAGDISEPIPGTALGALASPGGDNWALVPFTPATTAPESVDIMLQDGAGTGIFTTAGGRWQMVGVASEPLGCTAGIPAAVRAVWGLAACAATAMPSGAAAPLAVASGRSQLAEIAISEVGRPDTPAAHSFSGLDCNPYTAIEVSWASPSGCGIDSSFRMRNASELWCADFAKWVWRQAGVTSDLGVLTGSAATFYTWGRHHHETMPTDPKNPQVGEAVVFYPPKTKPNGKFADHVGIVTAVNSDGTVNLVNGDFLDSSGSNIKVEADSHVSLGHWSSRIWHRGEVWTFVSPKISIGTHRAAELIGAQSHKCADTYRAHFANGTREQIWTCHHGVGQTWTYNSRGELTVDGGKYCLDVKGSHVGNSSAVHLWQCTGKANQQWTFGPDGSIVGSQSGKCLNVLRGRIRNNTPLVIYACQGTSNERWAWG